LLAILLLAALKLHVANAEPSGEQKEEEVDSSSTESNEIIPREAIQKLDYSVRQALLRAIDKLEQEEAAATESGEENLSSSGSRSVLQVETSTLPSHREKDEILEESTRGNEPEPVVPTVQFYTATFDEKNAQEQLLSSFIDRSKLWKKTTIRKQNSPAATGVSLPLEPKSVEAQGPENRQLTRSVDSSSSGSVSSNEISHDSGSHEIKFEISNVRRATTPTP